jgi:alpha-1,3-glucan synthase
MFQLRDQFPVLNDGYFLESLSNKTYEVLFPGSGKRTSEFGVWSVIRSRTVGVQDFTGSGQGNQSVWFIYTNENTTVEHTFNCSSSSLGMIAPFPVNTTVKNLFYPYEEYSLTASTQKLGKNFPVNFEERVLIHLLGFEGSDEYNGCISQLTLAPWEYKALVPIPKFVEPLPVITAVLPSHDSRITSQVSHGQQEVVPIEIHFSMNMSCDAVTESLYFNSTTGNDETATLNKASVVCLATNTDGEPLYVGGIPTAWIFKANLTNVYNGVHRLTVNNATSSANTSTNVSNPNY